MQFPAQTNAPWVTSPRSMQQPQRHTAASGFTHPHMLLEDLAGDGAPGGLQWSPFLKLSAGV